MTLRAVATYLPQFSPNPDNDRWWGKDFTEWTNVRRGRSLFPGHDQPHVPGMFGYYDLRDVRVREAQADLARRFDISAFCYFHYWFGGGRRMLNQVFDEVLESGRPDFPFCLCWANETWTRRWDGGDTDILVEQTYAPDDDLRHAEFLMRAFADPRYFRVDGKPLFLIYKSLNIPDIPRIVDLLRTEARKAGIGDLYLCRVETGFHYYRWPDDPAKMGFDAAVEYPPHSVYRHPTINDAVSPDISGDEIGIFNYKSAAASSMDRPVPDYKLIRGAMLGFDNSARRGRNGSWIFHGATPDAFREWVRSAGLYAAAHARGQERLVFINSWNEWGEASHLEPDQRFGSAFLDALVQGLDSARAACSLLDRLDQSAPNEAAALRENLSAFARALGPRLYNLNF